MTPSKRCSVLVVDDDPSILEILRVRFSQAGVSITCAGSGAEAIEAIARTKFDAVVTDILMPVRDGFEVIGAVRRQQPNARIIAMSGGGRAARDEYLDLARMRRRCVDSVVRHHTDLSQRRTAKLSR